MRVILAQSPTISYVSPTRILRVPLPGEIGFGLSGGTGTVLRESTQPPIRASAVLSDAPFVLKIFVSLAVTLFLLALLLTAVCCLHGPLVWESMIRRLGGSKRSSSLQVIHRFNNFRVGERPHAPAKNVPKRSKEEIKCAFVVIKLTMNELVDPK